MKSIAIPGALITLLAATSVTAQGGAWSQCGGIGWTGTTSCVSGYYCSVLNPYYSQCIPGTATTTKATTTAVTTTKSTTTSSTTLKTSTTTTTSASTSPTAGALKYWFSFGNSYTATGFSASGTQPTRQNPMGNPTYPGQTTSNGPNWIDVVTVKYNRSATFTYNLAVSGATIDNSLVAGIGVPSMTDQVNTWTSAYSSKPASAPWTSTNTMFSAFIGINDIGGSYSRSDITTFIDTLLTAEFNLIAKLYNAGGRNFLFFSIPPMERSPLISGNPSWATTEKSVIATWNTKLQTYISNFKNSHTGVTTYFVDANAQFTMVLNNPTAYGLSSDVKSTGTNQQLFWADVYHPNTVMQGILGQEVARVANVGGFW
ncbi:hypothetical protein TWF694_003162 [Orbilia ellipsospora]|uniref:CBM1 domain-containing protein n=1 Tax=Orbilia ellipsospora TaxID=2528407 RepID=A0AAV9X1P1_9PEZI